MNRFAYIRYEGPLYPVVSALARNVGWMAVIVRKLESHLHYRRNPRSWQYMENLARENDSTFNTGKVFSEQALDSIDWNAMERLVLLWPDASGIGWSPVEKEVFRRLGPNTTLMVFNGRRRCFVLTRKNWIVWRFRRFVDKWFIGDTVALAVILVTAPFLVLADAIRGKA